MNDTLVHYGIPGQKWGRRRYQNEDGSLTPAGKKRYSVGNLLNIQSKTTTSRLTDTNPSKELVKGLTKNRNPLNIQPGETKYSRLTDANPSKSLVKAYSKAISSKNSNPLNIQSRTTRNEGIPIEEYNKLANRNVAEKVLDIRDRTSREEGIPIDEYNEQQNKKILNKITTKIKDVSQSTIQNGKNAVEKILNTIKKATTKIKDVSRQVVSTIGNKVNQILNIQEKSTTKRLTQRELDDEVVKIAYGVKKRGGRA